MHRQANTLLQVCSPLVLKWHFLQHFISITFILQIYHTIIQYKLRIFTRRNEKNKNKWIIQLKVQNELKSQSVFTRPKRYFLYLFIYLLSVIVAIVFQKTQTYHWLSGMEVPIFHGCSFSNIWFLSCLSSMPHSTSKAHIFMAVRPMFWWFSLVVLHFQVFITWHMADTGRTLTVKSTKCPKPTWHEASLQPVCFIIALPPLCFPLSFFLLPSGLQQRWRVCLLWCLHYRSLPAKQQTGQTAI